MKIAIVANLPAKGDMNIYACHLIGFKSSMISITSRVLFSEYTNYLLYLLYVNYMKDLYMFVILRNIINCPSAKFS